MTLADIRTEGDSSSVTVETAAVSDAASLSASQLDMMRAFFCYEFEVARLDRESVPEVTADAVAEWVEALSMSGLFMPSELRTMTSAWLTEPEALVSLLVGDVDEVAARREVESAPEPTVTPAYLRAS
jgi:hypothetical protein